MLNLHSDSLMLFSSLKAFSVLAVQKLCHILLSPPIHIYQSFTLGQVPGRGNWDPGVNGRTCMCCGWLSDCVADQTTSHTEYEENRKQGMEGSNEGPRREKKG